MSKRSTIAAIAMGALALAISGAVVADNDVEGMDKYKDDRSDRTDFFAELP